MKTVIWIVEIPVLSSLLCLAGDELSSKVQRKYPLFAFFSPAWGWKPLWFPDQKENTVSPSSAFIHILWRKNTSFTMWYLHYSDDTDLVKAGKGTSMAASFWMNERVSSFHNVAVCIQSLLVWCSYMCRMVLFLCKSCNLEWVVLVYWYKNMPLLPWKECFHYFIHISV